MNHKYRFKNGRRVKIIDSPYPHIGPQTKARILRQYHGGYAVHVQGPWQDACNKWQDKPRVMWFQDCELKAIPKKRKSNVKSVVN